MRRPAADAYKTHQTYWADTGDDIRVPVDPFDIATSMGVRVYEKVLGEKQDGYLDLDRYGHPVIYVNESHPRTRQRFTCAHEIGHLVDARNQGIAVGTWHRGELAASGTDDDEIYANRFAAALLMPKPALLKQVDRGLTTAELASRFRVSKKSMQWRLENLGVQVRDA